MPRQTNQLGRLQESLVLFKYMLHLFGCNDLKALSADLKDPALEGTNDEGESLLYHALVQHLYDLHISKEQLYEYDQNIIRHTKEINVSRTEKIQWKYYQYLSLLFTEVFLDKYFADRKALLTTSTSFRRMCSISSLTHGMVCRHLRRMTLTSSLFGVPQAPERHCLCTST